MPVPWHSLVASSIAALLLTPIAARVATSFGWVDRPGVRKVHGREVPYLGGAAVYFAFVVGLIVTASLPQAGVTWSQLIHPVPLVILLGASAMFVVGVVDDTRDLRARKKLLVQLLAAIAAVAAGVSIDGVQVTSDWRVEFGVFGPLLSLVWIVGVTNAVNIIDGLDGLAGGVALAAAAAMGAAGLALDVPAVSLILLVLAGAIAGYLPYNTHPARIFLGDAGSLCIGFVLACSALALASERPESGAFGVGLAALGVPILDTVFAMGRRIFEGRSILSADRNHIHHRFLAMGFGHSRTALCIAGATAIGAGLAAFRVESDGGLGWAPLVALGLYLMLFRLVGAMRLRDSLWGALAVASSARESTDERQRLDHVELVMRSATTIDDWWQTLGKAATELGFRRLELELPRRDGAPLFLSYGEPESDAVWPEVLLPIRQRRGTWLVQLRACASPDESLEVVGRQVAALSRVLDRCDLSKLPRTTRVVLPGQTPSPAKTSLMGARPA